MRTLLLVTTEFAASAHLMMSLVLFYFSRRNVQYLSQAWVMLLICMMYCAGLYYVATTDGIPPIGIMHPVLLVYLMACSYLQSIFPLGLCMPGYLQWGRMWQYATPALAIIAIYVIGTLCGAKLVRVYDAEDFTRFFLSGDVLLRFASLALSSYYIINMFRLPHRLVKKMEISGDLITYGSLLGLISMFFVVLTVWFNYWMLISYMLLFTLVNMFLFFNILGPAVQAIPYPNIKPVKMPRSREEICQTELEDFNAANAQRFETLEYVMQNQKPYIDSLFNRDKLCRLAGFNRHLLLQALRSQGYNDVHEYISRYRVAELKRMVMAGEITDLKQHERAGFRTLKTAMTAFERYEKEALLAWFNTTTGQTPEGEEGEAALAPPADPDPLPEA